MKKIFLISLILGLAIFSQAQTIATKGLEVGTKAVPVTLTTLELKTLKGVTTSSTLAVQLDAKANKADTITATSVLAPLASPALTDVVNITGNSLTDNPTLSSETLSSTGWTSTGWTGSWATGWTHTAGNTTALTQSTAASIGTKYQISYTITNYTTGTFILSFGGQSITQQSTSNTWSPTATSTAVLIITPLSAFDGTIVISIKSITAVSNSILNLKQSNGSVVLELRANTANQNQFIGINAGRYNTVGAKNNFYGNTSGSNNTSGSFCNFFGFSAGASNTTGSYNNFIGNNAGINNTSGSNNSFIGTNAGYSNVSGVDNNYIGYASGFSTQSGTFNVGIGASALYSITASSNNIGIGYYAGRYIAAGSANTNSGTSIFIGNDTRPNVASGANEIVIGSTAVGAGSNTATLGNTSITDTYLRGILHINAMNTAPASATAVGVLGEIRVTAAAIYVCTATNTWVKCALATW